MPHGQPDFGMYAARRTIASLADMGELAARLGSINTYDRRGDVIFLEDFTNGLIRWLHPPVGGGSSVDIANDRFRSGGCSCKFVTSNLGTGGVQIRRFFPVPITSRTGLELSFSHTSNIDQIQIYLRIHTGIEYHQYTARHFPKTGVLEIWRSGPIWQDVGHTFILKEHETLFHTIKFVGDYDTNKYVRILLDNFSADLSTYDCITDGAPASPYGQVNITIYPVPVANENFWVDDIILTQNEP